MKKDLTYFKVLVKDIWIASRPLSLTLAVASTTLGIVVAYNQGFLFNNQLGLDWFKIILITVAGILAQLGAYFPFGMGFSWISILIAMPPSFFIPALMISNEMRDFTRDKGLSLGTLSVRIGSENSKKLYAGLVFGAYLLTAIYVALGICPISTLLVFFTLPLAFKAYKYVASFKGLGISYTNNLHWLFNLIFVGSLLIQGFLR